MPIKKRPNVLRPASQRRTSDYEKAQVTRKAFPFWTVFVIMLLYVGLFIVGSMACLLYNQQVAIISALNALGGKVEETGMLPTAQESQYQYQQTSVKNLYLFYEACRPSFTGACDDAKLYRLATDGSKQIILPSLRSLPGAPLGSELLQPIEQSVGGQYIVFGAWAFGSERNPTDRRVWVFDTVTASVVVQSNKVPSGSVFSPDYAYAAYASLIDNDMQDLMIVNLKEDKVVSGAKAKTRHSFKSPNGEASIRWQDAKNLFIKEYVTDEGGTTESGEVHVKVK
ncbi:MAG: hypothetical protein WC750_00230 [Patescibacteria group bacterium]|jgi:hypothetical protein